MKNTSSTTNLIATAVIISAVTAGFATGPAFSQQPEAFKFQFTYNPAELTTAPAAEKLLVRLQQDVRSYCGGIGKMSLDERSRVNDCIDATMRESVAKFGSATVAQAFQNRADG
jgi:UrcA family protein